MNYFSQNYKFISFPIADAKGNGLYNAQIGAIHAIASHFTINQNAAIVTMPTGSGKTAVLMMSPFLLRSKRVLIITPSRMVRSQIKKDFAELKTLKKIKVVSTAKVVRLPKVIEVESKINDPTKWEALKAYDVVVSTPNCISPAYEEIPTPPADLFDLILIDEAHHSPAKSWNELLKSFVGIRNILFTATPFRRDRQEIVGKFIYSYPLAKAYSDGIFGRIEYIPVNEENADIDNDVALAQKTEQVFKEDRSKGFNHKLMVRTDSKKKADSLVDVYKTHTKLKLQVIHSAHSFSRMKEVIELMETDRLDGIICVNMLGEGFDFPRLKIATIHTPHKSLEVTLQFIGRFARTNAKQVDSAKFLAVPSEIELEGEKLFEEGAVWQEMVIGLSHLRVGEEVETREVLQEFDDPKASSIEIKDLSLYALTPRKHVKIYQVKNTIDILQSINLKTPYEICYKNINKRASVVLLIAREVTKPKWSRVDQMLDLKYDLFIIFYDKKNQLLFINSSRSVDGLYEFIAKALDPNAKGLPTNLISKVLKDLNNTNFFNIGMRNRIQSNNAESYKIMAGPSAQAAVKESDARFYTQGHAYGTAEDEGKKISIGFSSGSKVWSSSALQIPQLINWCKALGNKIRSRGGVKTNSALDNIPVGRVVDNVPEGVAYADWDKDAYDYDNPVEAVYTSTITNTEVSCHITDLSLVIDYQHITDKTIQFNVEGLGVSYPIKFSLENSAQDFFTPLNVDPATILIRKGEYEATLVGFINSSYVHFYTGNGSELFGNELAEPAPSEVVFDVSSIEQPNWLNTNIQNEEDPEDVKGISIHEFIKNRLLAETQNKIIFYDHGSGEIADFLVVRQKTSSYSFEFYHCKKSGAATAGARIKDVYEVCGQAQKSLRWTNSINKLYYRMVNRNKPEKFIKGNFPLFKDLIEAAKLTRNSYNVIIVQPGLSCSQVTSGISECLSATSDHVTVGGCGLKILASP